MKKIVFTLIFGFLLLSNSFAMEDQPALPLEDTAVPSAVKSPEKFRDESPTNCPGSPTLDLENKMKEISLEQLKIQKEHIERRAVVVLNEETKLKNISELLGQTYNNICTKNDSETVKLAKYFLGFIYSKLDAMVNKRIPKLQPQDLGYQGFNRGLNIDLQRWVVYINKKPNLPLILNLIALIYLKRLVDINPSLIISINNVHRLFLVSLHAAEKSSMDIVYNNTDWVKIGGNLFDLQTINTMEFEFLELLDFNLLFSDEEFYNLYNEFFVFIKTQEKNLLEKKN